MKLVMDCEANGLYEEATEIHCAVFKDADTGRVWKFRKRDRSEERRVGKECRARWSPNQ